MYPHHLWPELGDNWGRDAHAFCGRYDGLRFVRLNPLGAFCLGGADTYSGTVAARAKIFHVLPNLDLTFTGEARPDPADLAFLEHLAVPAGESVWRLDPERILVHIEGGGSFEELTRFLEQNAAEALPEDVRTWFGELQRKARACRTARDAVLLEWEDAAQALLISTTAGLKQLCHHAGENRVVVPARHLAAFTRLARKLGHVLPRVE